MRRPSLRELSATTFDLLIIGGGIIGCAVARDAALRGLRVALVEREDFGSGTTSRSTRLIHGGLRYLELFDFGLVREDLREREILLRLAPHLVKPLPFLVPMYRYTPVLRARLQAGMLLYDLLSFDKSLPNHRFLSRAETLRREPNLDPDGLQGAARFFDAQVNFPERLCLEYALDAAALGAWLRSYTEATGFVVEGGAVVGVAVRDALDGDQAVIRARQTMNVSGAWLDRLLGAAGISDRPLLRTTRGVHLATPPLGSNAVVLEARSDRRVFFVVPWQGMSLIGTTDTDETGPPETTRPAAEDVRYLVEETRRAFPTAGAVRPHYTMAGVRALVRREGVRESQVSRRHAVVDHARRGGPAGLLSVAGGKITGARGIAEDAVDAACRALGRPARSATAHRPLPGRPLDSPDPGAEVRTERAPAGAEDATRRYLLHRYGRRAGEVLALAAACTELRDRVSADQPTIAAEVVHAAREESVVRLADFMLRRTALGLAPGHGLTIAPRVASVLARELGWDAEREAEEVRAYRQHVERTYTAAPV